MFAGKMEGRVLFNGALNIFYLQSHDIRHMVNNHCNSERGNPLPFSSKGSFISHRQDNT